MPKNGPGRTRSMRPEQGLKHWLRPIAKHGAGVSAKALIPVDREAWDKSKC